MRARTRVLCWLILSAIPTAFPAAQAPTPAPIHGTNALDRAPTVHITKIRAHLDATTATLTGVERVRWRNTTSRNLDELQFHLYLNAFSGRDSTFLSGPGLFSLPSSDVRWGGIDIKTLRIAGGPRLDDRLEFITDDGNTADRTLVRLPLEAPLAAGAWIELVIEFESRLPSIISRTGMEGDFVFGGQWFPKLGVVTDEGWRSVQYHGLSEYFADFGRYEVTLDLPARYAGKIAGTGVLVDETIERSQGEGNGGDGDHGDRVIARFEAEAVHDFAWSADPNFVVSIERFEPERDVSAEVRARRPEAVAALTPVELRLFTQASRPGHKARILHAARSSLAEIGSMLAPYPYPTLTLIDPPLGLEEAGGMEYATLATLHGNRLVDMVSRVGLDFNAPEVVTVHEIAHQWFQGMSASDETREAWLDEGLTSYVTARVLEAMKPEIEGYGGFGQWTISPWRFERIRLQERDGYTPIAQPAASFPDSWSYGAAVYGRAALLLKQLERTLGRETFDRALRAFFLRAQWRHPTTADFERVFALSTGADLDPLLRQALHEGKMLDYELASFDSEPIFSDGALWTDGDRPADLWRSEVVVRRNGEMILPVEVELRFEGGIIDRLRWDGEAPEQRWTFDRPQRLLSAQVDPDDLYVLDAFPFNNGLTAEPSRLPVTRPVSRIATFLQALFVMLGG